MITWFFYSLLSIFANTGMILCLQRLKNNYHVDVYLFYIWLIAASLLSSIFPPFHQLSTHWSVFPLILIAGIASWMGNLAYGNSLDRQSNSGYVEALSSIRVPITYLVAILFLQSRFDLLHMLALIGTVGGVFLVCYSPKSSNMVRSGWIIWSIFSGFMYAVLAIANKIVFNLGIPPTNATAAFFSLAAILYLLTAVTQKHSIKLSKDIWVLVLGGIFAAIGNIALFMSYSSSPNLAYPVAISGSRMVILYLISTMLSKEKFNLIKSWGIIITFISVLLLS